ncbi:hypothetical protein DSL92_07460 [Billgrantia gudaonensis]|uniref:Uncharacterized protein n=1 Tax=Billgrantia gudaonensis TaxID=376427 RepID=A0A432JIE7_9GAMM|nr:hypothetical protein DSL92_07460 [Halomonas gudaonensis]
MLVQTLHSDDAHLRLLTNAGYDALPPSSSRGAPRRPATVSASSPCCAWRAQEAAVTELGHHAGESLRLAGRTRVGCRLPGSCAGPHGGRQGRYHLQPMLGADKRSRRHEAGAWLRCLARSDARGPPGTLVTGYRPADAELTAGSWKLEAGSWKLEAGSWKLEDSKKSPQPGSRGFFQLQLTSAQRTIVQLPTKSGEGLKPHHNCR